MRARRRSLPPGRVGGRAAPVPDATDQDTSAGIDLGAAGPLALHTIEPDWSDARDLCGERIERRRREGRNVVVKRAHGPGATSLRREAAVLQALAGPAVVEFVERLDTSTGEELWTLDAGAASLADPWSGSAAERAEAFAIGCSRLADLHASGWFHGAVALDHLVVDARSGAARWCSLGSAGRTAADPAGLRLDRVSITRAAHRLARSLPGAHGLRRRIERLGDEAEPRRLARTFRHWSRRRRTRPMLPAAPEWRPGLARVVSAIGVAAVLTGALVAAGRNGERDGGPPADPPDRATPGRAQVEPTLAGTGADPAPEVEAPGPELELAGRMVRLGSQGDLVTLADIRCDGTTRPFLFRPDTGEVFDFPGWNPGTSGAADDPTVAIAGRLIARDRTFRGLRAGPACGPPIADRDDGSSTPVLPP